MTVSSVSDHDVRACVRAGVRRGPARPDERSPSRLRVVDRRTTIEDGVLDSFDVADRAPREVVGHTGQH